MKSEHDLKRNLFLMYRTARARLDELIMYEAEKDVIAAAGGRVDALSGAWMSVLGCTFYELVKRHGRGENALDGLRVGERDCWSVEVDGELIDSHLTFVAAVCMAKEYGERTRMFLAPNLPVLDVEIARTS